MAKLTAKRLIHAHSNAHLHRHAIDFLHARQTALVLAPSRATADDLIRDASATPGQGFLGVQRLTLTQLAASLAAPRLAQAGLKPASRLAIEALTTRIIAAAHKAQQIPYFAPVAATPGLAPAIAATLAELRLEQITELPHNDLATLLTAFEHDANPAQLLDAVYGTATFYDEVALCSSAKVCDPNIIKTNFCSSAHEFANKYQPVFAQLAILSATPAFGAGAKALGQLC